MKSDTYRRSKAKKEEHSKWELVYGTIAARLIRSGKFTSTHNLFAVSKFLGAFVYVFSFVYEPIKMLKLKIKVAMINKKAK